MSVYNVFVLSIIGAVVSLTLEGSAFYDASFMRLIMSTSLTMLSVFAPKVRIFCLETYLLHVIIGVFGLTVFHSSYPIKRRQ